MALHQLTYASTASSAERSGGWQVLEESPGIPSDRRNALEMGVMTRIDEIKPVDEYASEEELAGRVRALTYHPMTSLSVWWHAVPAGPDATGRPGNVFTHAVMADEVPLGLRPVDLVDFDQWLTPFGPMQVAGSRLPEFSLEAIPSGREAALERAFGAPEQTECLLAAVVHCFADSRPLVMVADDPREAIGWIQVISWLTAGRVSQRLPFATFARASDVATEAPEFLIRVIPREDVDAVLAFSDAGAHTPLLLDVDSVPEEGDGEVWRHHGQEWKAAEHWQDAFFLLRERPPSKVQAVLDRMDEMLDGLGSDDLLNPEWPLTLAMLAELGEEHPEADKIRRDWKRLQPWAELDDEVLLDLLCVEDPPQSSDSGAPIWAGVTAAARKMWEREGWPLDAEILRTPLPELIRAATPQLPETFEEMWLLLMGLPPVAEAGAEQAEWARTLRREHHSVQAPEGPPVLQIISSVLESWLHQYETERSAE